MGRIIYFFKNVIYRVAGFLAGMGFLAIIFGWLFKDPRLTEQFGFNVGIPMVIPFCILWVLVVAGKY